MREAKVPEGLLAKFRALFEGDPAVRKVANDPQLTAELLLLFRVALADGKVEEAELATLRRVAEEAFGISQASFGKVVEYLQDFGYETTGRQAVALFANVGYERKKMLIEHMEAIARADNDLDDREAALIHRTIALLNEQAD